MSNRKIIRLFVVLLLFIAAFYLAVTGNTGQEILMLFLCYINYKIMEKEE